jgi:hypothetical protein
MHVPVVWLFDTFPKTCTQKRLAHAKDYFDKTYTAKEDALTHARVALKKSQR